MLSVILVHAQQVVRCCAVIVHVVTKAFQNVILRESEILNFTKNLFVELKVIVVLIKECSGLILQFLSTDKVLVSNVLLRNDLLL